MTTITLPPNLEAWADAQVAAGRAPSVNALVTQALEEVRALHDFRASLDAAETEGEGAPGEAVFDRLKARFAAE
jgi:Arc/MetJ-type ribon-helix-helix transcriptional regulator